MDSLKPALEWRYAPRLFDPTQKLPDATVATILEEAILTPSSFGLQPYEFIVVADPAIRETLKAAAWGQPQIMDASHLVVIAARTDLNEAFVDAYIQRIATVRGITTESLNPMREMMVGSIKARDAAARTTWAQKQSYIALGTIIASASVRHVDTGPMEGFDPAKFDEILGLTAKHLTATTLICLGHRSADDKAAHYKKVRWPSSRMIHHA